MALSTTRPAEFVAQRMKRKHFTHTANVHIHGDVKIEERLVVGGNLVVDGNLTAHEIYCVGKITVKGDVNFTQAYVGIAIHAGGSISGIGLNVGFDAEHIATMMGLEVSFEDDDDTYYLDHLVHPDIASELDYERQNRMGESVVIAGKFFDLCDIEVNSGDIEVGGYFNVDTANILIGNLLAQSIYVDDDLFVGGSVDSSSDITVQGEIHSSHILCIGNIDAGSIKCDGSIDAVGFIQATGDIVADEDIQTRRWIATSGKIQAIKFIKASECVVADKGIRAGNDYGVLAGVGLPRSQWLESGFISAPVKPRNILTGRFILGKTAESIREKEADRDCE